MDKVPKGEVCILEEAKRIVEGERNELYGHPSEDFTKVARIWSVLLGGSIRAEQIPLCMVALKLVREANVHKTDNLVDIAGYAKTAQMLHSTCYPEVNG